VIVTLGNRAVHSHRDIPQSDAMQAVKELFHFCYWFARLYARGKKPDAQLAFDESALPTTTIPKQTLDQLKRLETQIAQKDEKLSIVLAGKENLDAEIKRRRKEVAEAKQAAANVPDNHNYNEAETRDYFIDLLLKEAGWLASCRPSIRSDPHRFSRSNWERAALKVPHLSCSRGWIHHRGRQQGAVSSKQKQTQRG
jgi:type I restriction enzyme, R subunit